jgi:hypothetical protein
VDFTDEDQKNSREKAQKAQNGLKEEVSFALFAPFRG